MGSVGDAHDNAMCESFLATRQCELLDRRKFKTKAEARSRPVPWRATRPCGHRNTRAGLRGDDGADTTVEAAG